MVFFQYLLLQRLRHNDLLLIPTPSWLLDWMELDKNPRIFDPSLALYTLQRGPCPLYRLLSTFEDLPLLAPC